MGIRCSRWVTMHGFAFNVNADLSYFNHIIPCGIDDKQVTGLRQLLGHEVDAAEVKKRIICHFQEVFDVGINKANSLYELEHEFSYLKKASRGAFSH